HPTDLRTHLRQKSNNRENKNQEEQLSMEAYFASLNPMDLLGRFPSGIAQGLIWGIMALGVYITFRLLDIADLSVDGTFSTGAAVTVMLILAGWNPWAALVIAFIAGLIAGSVTGLLHTVFGIPAILAGILTQYGLYSINLVIMKMKANQAVSVDKYNLIISGRNVPNAILVGGIFAIALIVILYSSEPSSDRRSAQPAATSRWQRHRASTSIL
ncbi:MAG: ABC transporter permease subunit, partial [Syntrophomonadaceae bacterium]